MAAAEIDIEVRKAFEGDQRDCVERHTEKDLQWAVEYHVGVIANSSEVECTGCANETECGLSVNEFNIYPTDRDSRIIRFKIACSAERPTATCVEQVMRATQRVTEFLDECEELDAEIEKAKSEVMVDPQREAANFEAQARQAISLGEQRADELAETLKTNFRQNWFEPAAAGAQTETDRLFLWHPDEP